jgi:hypothetical protein
MHGNHHWNEWRFQKSMYWNEWKFWIPEFLLFLEILEIHVLECLKI